MKVVESLVSFAILISNVQADCSYHCEASNCPCDCIKKEVQCGNRNATRIYEFPSHRSYETMDFGNNRISSVERRHFSGHHMQKLHTLMLPDNQIEEIEDYSFKTLLHLTSLFLNTNRIKTISADTFAGLHKLNKLYLNDNQIETLTENVFDSLKSNLKLLYLQNNQIRFIAEKTFREFPHLKTLDLRGNKLGKLDSTFVYTSPSLAYLFMGNNPWVCDEESACLSYGVAQDARKRSKKQLILRDKMVCHIPEKYKLKDMTVVLQLFQCKHEDTTQRTTTMIPMVTEDTHSNGQWIVYNPSLQLCCLLAWMIVFPLL